MRQKTFDCVAFQRKIQDEFLKEANYDFQKFKLLIREKIDNSDFVKSFKEKLNVN